MDGQTIVATIAATVSLVAMGVTAWQAAEARKARKATEKQLTTAEAALKAALNQAESAKESASAAWRAADSAETSAHATQRQADIADAALQDARAVRDETDGPEFELKPGTSSKPGQKAVAVSMTRGPQVRVTMTDVRPDSSVPHEEVAVAAENRTHTFARNTTREFVVDCPRPDNPRLVYLRIELSCEEVRGRKRRWIRYESVSFPGPMSFRELGLC
jgi:hypothetical protein